MLLLCVLFVVFRYVLQAGSAAFEVDFLCLGYYEVACVTSLMVAGDLLLVCHVMVLYLDHGRRAKFWCLTTG